MQETTGVVALAGAYIGLKSLLISPGAQELVAVGTDGSAAALSLSTRTPIALPPWQRNKVLAAGFSSDGSDLLLGTQDGKIRTYSSATGAPLSDAAVLSAMADRLIADAPGGLLIALSQSGGLAVWNQRKPQLTIQGGDFPLFARFDAARRLDLLLGAPGKLRHFRFPESSLQQAIAIPDGSSSCKATQSS